MAEALRTDAHGWKALLAPDPLWAELRLLCRDEVALIEPRTALVNQLQAARRESYPAALEAFAVWTQPSAWAFVLAFPTPEKLQQAGRRQWEKFLHTHKLWRSQTVPRRLEIFHRAADFLRSTVPLWANLSRRDCPWAQAYYQAHRAKGKSHACALRCLGHRWLKILWRIWQNKTRYSPEVHQKNQLAHGSWVLQLTHAKPS